MGQIPRSTERISSY